MRKPFLPYVLLTLVATAAYADNAVPTRLTERAMAFRSPAGAMIITDGICADPLYASADGKTFRRMVNSGFDGTGNSQYVVTFTDPSTGSNGSFKRDGDSLSFKDAIYTKVEVPGSFTAIPFPKVRIPEYLYRLPDGRYVYVSDDKYSESYDGFRLFIGSGKDLKPVHVNELMRLRDGGTTIIDTPRGTFFTPSPFNRGSDDPFDSKDASWTAVGSKKKIVLHKVELTSVTIKETPSGVTIATK